MHMLMLPSPKSRYRTFPSLEKFPSCPFPVSSHHLLQKQRLFNSFHHGLVLPIIEVQINEIMQHVLFCVCRFSLNKIFWRFNIVVFLIVLIAE